MANPNVQFAESAAAATPEPAHSIKSTAQTTKEPSTQGAKTTDIPHETGRADTEAQQPKKAKPCRGIWREHDQPNRLKCEECRNNILSATAILLVAAVLIPSCLTLQPLKSDDRKEGKPLIGIVVVGLLLPFVVVGVLVAVLAHRAASREEKREEGLKVQHAEAVKVQGIAEIRATDEGLGKPNKTPAEAQGSLTQPSELRAARSS